MHLETEKTGKEPSDPCGFQELTQLQEILAFHIQYFKTL